MKGKIGCYKKGGKVKESAAEERKEEKEEHKKDGGHVKAHKAHGKTAKHRPDKKARGGKVATPKSPLSGAEPKGLPGGGKGENAPTDKEND